MRFGHKWLSLIDSDDLLDLTIADWRERLAGLTETDVLYGLSVMKQEWPPSPDEFRDLCEGRAKYWQHNTAAYRPFRRDRALEVKADKEKAKKAMEEIQNILSRA